MIYSDNNVLGSMLAEGKCEISVTLCLFLWPLLEMMKYLIGD